MTAAVWFWIIYVVGVLFYGYLGFRNRETWYTPVFIMVLIFILGWGQFGSPLK